MNKVFLLVALIPCFVGCKNSKEAITETNDAVVVATTPVAEPPDTLATTEWIRYGRTPCFGMCPYFNLVVFGDGHALYEGKNFVDLIGIYHTTFDTASLQIIQETAERIGYFSLNDSYDNPHVTDLPTITTSIRQGGTMKTVANRYKGPAALKELYDRLDEMIRMAHWESSGK